MTEDEQAGRKDGAGWADLYIETRGVKWLEGIEIGSDVPAWEAFKRCCVALGAGDDVNPATDMDWGPYPREYIDAFVAAALERLRDAQRQPQ